MEFHKKIQEKKEKEIINIKRIKPNMPIIENQMQYNIPNVKQYQTKKLILSEKEKIKTDINNILDGNEVFCQQMDSSIGLNSRINTDNNINTNEYFQRIPNNSFEKYNSQIIKEIPIKKTYSQSLIVNPLNRIEYLNNSSQTIGTNSLFINPNSEKYSNSQAMIDSMNNNINNINNINEIEANSDRDNSFKIRYHRAKRYSPFYKNNFMNNNTYNRIYEQEYNNINNYEINELNELDKIKVTNTKQSNNNINDKQFLYSSDEGLESPKNESNNYYKRTLVRKFTDIYDPNKNKKGLLLPKTKMTFSLSSSPLSFEKRRNISKNSKLSEFIINQKKSSPDNLKSNEEFYSGSEDRTTWQNDTRKREKKTFNRRSFEKYQQSKTLIRLNKSPQERFKNITLAMISSKGKNTENRPILTNMRFERGGVVDLAQSEIKKNKYKYLIRKIQRPKVDELIHNNPKYREKAAQLIKEWWFAIREYRKKKHESAILIQSYFRGRFVRKYLYDVIYMNYIYFGFCKKIEKFIKKKYGPIFFDALFNKYIKQKNLLKKIIEEKNKKQIKLYLKKWNLINKKNNRKNLALLYILRIRAIRESKMFNLKRVFSKWNYVSIIKKERTDNKKIIKGNIEYDSKEIEKEINKIETNVPKKEEINEENDDINKIRGLFKILKGTDILMKKKAMEKTNEHIKNYLNEIIKKKNISQIKKDADEIIRIKLELFIKKLEPFICSNKNLYDLFFKLIIGKIKRMKIKTRKYRNKTKELEGNDDEDYIYSKEYRNKKIKKEKIEEYDIIDSQEEDIDSDVNIDKKRKKQDNTELSKYKKELEFIKKYYLLKNIIKIKKTIDDNKMRKYYYIWKYGNNNNDIFLNDNDEKNLIKIQKYVRQKLSKNKLEKIKKLNNILIKIISRQNKNKYKILLFYIRKWNSYIKQLNCLTQIEQIQKAFKRYIKKKSINKLKILLSKGFKKYILNTFDKIAKIKKLKSIFENIIKNKIKSRIERIVTNKKIGELLLKRIINNENVYNNDLKRYYLNKWKNRKNILKNRDNKRMKRLLMKIFNKKDNIKKLLKLYFLRWQKNQKLSLINDSAIIIQRNWRNKKIIDINNKRKKDITIFANKINDKINKKLKQFYLYFFEIIKNLNKKYILLNLSEHLAEKRINIFKDAMNKINIFIRKKYLLKIISISNELKKRILRKYIKIWNDKSYIKNKKFKYLKKYLIKKEHIEKGLKLTYLYKWLYHSKYITMKNNIKKIQNEYRNYTKKRIVISNWIKIINVLSNKKYKKEIKEIKNGMKTYLFFKKMKNIITKETDENIFNKFRKYNKDSLFKIKMRNIINKINKERYYSLLQKYLNIWNNNIKKEIEREEKLNDLLYAIEKRMNINSVKFLSQVSLIKNIYNIYAKFRKYEYFKKLIKYVKTKEHISNLSLNLSSAFDDIKTKEKKIVLSKIFKYFVYLKFIKLFDKIRINRNKEVKQYKIKLLKYLKNKKIDYSSSEKRRKKNSMQYMSPKQKVDNTKKLDKSKTKSQSIITISNKKTRNFKEKENEKEIIKKKIVKGFNNKKKYGKNKIFGDDKFKEDKISKSESEYESENNQIKENINAIYEPLLGALNKVINKIIIRKKKEYLITIKKNIKIVKEEKQKEKKYYIHKLYKTLRSITIKKLFIKKNELLKAKKLINLIKITRINSQISTDRYIRQIIRRWRFISFVKIMSKKKLELMYKNLHMGYLEIINSLFNNESEFPSIIKEFENFGSNIGMYKNSDILNKEKDLYQKVKKKYISKPIEYDRQNLMNIESGNFINELKYKSDEEQGEDYTDSDKDVINKLNNRMRRCVNYDRDKP